MNPPVRVLHCAEARSFRILMVEPDDVHAEALRELLSCAGYPVHLVSHAEAALSRALPRKSFHLVLAELDLPDLGGLALLHKVRDACPSTALVLMSRRSSISVAITAGKLGVAAYLPKPMEPRALLGLCQRLANDAPPYLPNALKILPDTLHWEGLLAGSLAMREVLTLSMRVAKTPLPVLIQGEAGVGKHTLACAVHRLSGATGPCLRLRTATLVPEMLSAELFGYQAHAFLHAISMHRGLLEQAAGGTVYIDEIAELPLKQQELLLTMLQTGTYCRLGGRKDLTASARVLLGTRHVPEELVGQDRLLPELWNLLRPDTIRLPLLRERGNDCLLLAAHFAREAAQRAGKAPLAIPAQTQRLLRSYPWPGNLAELRTVVERAVLMARSAVLEPELVRDSLPSLAQRSLGACLHIPLGTPLQEIERQVILRTLEATGNRTATAELLGMSRRSLYNRLEAYGLPPIEAESEGELRPAPSAAKRMRRGRKRSLAAAIAQRWRSRSRWFRRRWTLYRRRNAGHVKRGGQL